LDIFALILIGSQKEIE